MDRRAPRLVLPCLALMLLLAGLLDRPATGGAASEWATGAYRDTRLDSGGEMPGGTTSGSSALTRGGATPRDVAVKLEQAGVVRPRLIPGERAQLVARYAVADTVDVRETRTLRFNDQVLLTRENVVKRAPGQWRSQYELPVPPSAVEGLYTVTTRVEPLSGAKPAARGAEERLTIFSVERKPDQNAGTGGDGDPRITLWTERTRYRIGDTVTFYFQTNRDGYVMLVNTGTSGAVTQLYPNRYSQGHAVKGRLRYSIPRQEDTYTMNVSGPPGIDLVYALFTLQPITFAETDFSRTRSIFLSMNDRTGPLTRDINLAVKQAAAQQRARDALELEIVP